MQPTAGGTSIVNGIFHPVVTVSNMDVAARFYRDILGLRQTFNDMHDPAAISRLFGFNAPIVHSIVLECEDHSEFELIEYRRPRGRETTDREMNDSGISALALRVTGLDDLVRRVEAASYSLLSGIVEQVLPDGAVLRVAVCIGPDNVKTILVEPPVGRKSLGA
jgi:catechol 2,3-dioxygenase-like lactoylglutathione lyase family enzyme